MTQINDKKEAIFNATLKLVSKHGFHGTSMAMIYKEASVSAGTIYNYFHSKDELLLELFKKLKNNMAEAVESKVDTSEPLTTLITTHIELLLRYHLENAAVSAYLDQFMKSPFYNLEIENEVMEYFKVSKEILTKAMEQRIIKDYPFLIISVFVIDVASSIAQKQSIGILNIDESLINRLVKSIWQALRA